MIYSGENGARFHEMVVRGLAEPAARPGQERKPGVKPTEQGFALKPGKGGSFEFSFDLAALAADAKAHLEDFETNTRKGTYSFREKKHEVDPTDLVVVAFVQDEATKQILQAVYVKPAAGKKVGSRGASASRSVFISLVRSEVWCRSNVFDRVLHRRAAVGEAREPAPAAGGRQGVVEL